MIPACFSGCVSQSLQKVLALHTRVKTRPDAVFLQEVYTFPFRNRPDGDSQQHLSLVVVFADDEHMAHRVRSQGGRTYTSQCINLLCLRIHPFWFIDSKAHRLAITKLRSDLCWQVQTAGQPFLLRISLSLTCFTLSYLATQVCPSLPSHENLGLNLSFQDPSSTPQSEICTYLIGTLNCDHWERLRSVK
jgi:hypothetical protein